MTTSKRPYFRATAPSQREFLFRVAAATGNISQAARQAHVGRGTYYYWRDRYQAQGAAGLAQERSRAPHRTCIPPVSEEVRNDDLAYCREHPDEQSYRMIAYRLRQRHGRLVISHTKVGEIIRAARAAGQLDEPPPSAHNSSPKLSPASQMKWASCTCALRRITHRPTGSPSASC